MKVSLKWLSEYVDVPDDLKAFCDRLDLTGTGVEGVETLGESFENVVTGQVVEKVPHPDSDHMFVCKVDVGNYHLDEDENPQPLQIVCGAQNFNEGDHIVVALEGAVLPGDFKIKKSKKRGVVSYGMNCSERELGMGTDHDGIMILPPDAPIGMPFAEYASLTDTVLDLEITPNRPDCQSIVGLAREVGAMYQIPYTSPLEEMLKSFSPDTSAEPIDKAVSVRIEDAALCPRYTAHAIYGCKVGPSPAWMVKRLQAIGQRSINNIVDATNYILFLFGQPLHAFDLAKIKSKSKNGRADIVVRPAKEGESLTTLDGMDRVLSADMTVIATPDIGAIALAGVMGGMDTEVTDETSDILLEAATFNPGRTSRTSRKLGLISESSLRYERGVTDSSIALVAHAAAGLIAEVSSGTVAPCSVDDTGMIDIYPQKTQASTLEFRIARFQNMIGDEVERDFILDVLSRLGCEVNATAEIGVLSITPPTFRPDLEREIDLYEEVLRLWGMDKITATLPGGRGRFGVRTRDAKWMDKVHMAMRASGVNETMTYSFADPRELDILRMDAQTLGLGEPVELLNPMNAEQSLMRRSIVPGLLRSVVYNKHHGVHNVALYETGVVFCAVAGKKKPKEREKLACVLAGSIKDVSWNEAVSDTDFFDAKGVIENLIREFAIDKVRFKVASPEEAPHLQPGRAAFVFAGGAKLGWVGELHPQSLTEFEINAPVAAFELDINALMKAARPARDFLEICPMPPVHVDVAFVVDEDVTYERLINCVKSAGGKLLASAELFDVYRDPERVGQGKKSYAIALTYQSFDRTLNSEEVEKAKAKLIKKVSSATGAEVRA